jgi:hypothetical protein
MSPDGITWTFYLSYTYDQYLVVPICDFNGMLAVTKQLPTWDLGRRRRDKNYRGLIRQQ